MLLPVFRSIIFGSILALVLTIHGTDGRILTLCQAVTELQRAGVSRSFVSNWACLMRSESGMDTGLITGPHTASSYSYGIFQINSMKYCNRSRKGGLCNRRCDDFANDDIQDDIICAKKIHDIEGFKAWPGWVKRCKQQPLPNIGGCRR